MKHLDSLLIRARELDREGLTTYILTGGFQLPLKSLTDNILSDLIYIDKVIGIGEIGIGDSFGSNSTIEEITRIAANARVEGALSEKSGKILIHLGPSSQGSNLISEVINNSDVPIKQFVITHVNRNMELLDEAIEFAKLGGIIDVTTGISPEFGINESIAPYDALKYIFEKNVPVENITLSSDAGGFRSIDDDNNKIGDVLLLSDTLLDTLKKLKKIHNIDFTQTLKTVTSKLVKYGI